MTALYDLQKKFANSLKSDDAQVLSYICCSDQLSASQHIGIYQNSIFAAKQKVLQEIYPVCKKLVGDEFFIAMINNYIPQAISQSPDLGDYGLDFPKFVAKFKPAKSLPYLSDVTRLEVAWHQTNSAAEPTGFDFQKLSEYCTDPREKTIFQLSPGSTLITSPYPIHRIWEVNQDEYLGDQTVGLPANTQFNFYIWREYLETRIDLLTLPEWQMLTWMQSGLCLDEICDKTNETLIFVNVEELLPKMVSLGWITGFVLT